MDDDWAAEIGRRIKIARERHDMSQAALGDVIGLSAGAIGNYERGDRDPFSQVRKIAEATDADLRWLLHGESYQDPLRRIEAKLDRALAHLAPDLLPPPTDLRAPDAVQDEQSTGPAQHETQSPA